MVQRTINRSAAGRTMRPIMMQYTPFFHPISKAPNVFRSHTVVYSSDMGTLTEPDYVRPADEEKTGARLSLWNVREAIREIKRLERAKVEFAFVTARCTASFALAEDCYEQVKALIEQEQLGAPSKLCLEFPQSVLFPEGDAARLTVMNMRVLGVRTMITGVGSNDCPVGKLLSVPADALLLDEGAVALVHDRNKPGVLVRFVAYLKSMNFAVYADRVESDDDLRELNRMGIAGFSLSDKYEGAVKNPGDDLLLEDILEEKEDKE